MLESHAARTADWGEELPPSSASSREQAELLARYQSSFDDEQVITRSSVVDPHHVDVDQDADPGSTYQPDADPDPTFHPDADPDPGPDPSFKKRLKPLKQCYNRLLFHTF